MRIFTKCFGNIKICCTFACGFGDESNGPGRFPEQKITVMATLKYTTREINHNYKIKVAGIYDGKKVNTLVGVTGLVKMVNDIDLTNRLLDRAFSTMGDVCVCKLRRGIKISFYVA